MTISIPEALRTQHTHPRTDQFAQLWRYGLVDDSQVDRLLDRLAGATAQTSLPAGVYSSLTPPLQSTGDDGVGAGGAVYRQAIKAATAFTFVDYAWVPLDETPSTMERNSDVTLHLTATLASPALNDPHTLWSIHSLGRPESGASPSSAVAASANPTLSTGASQTVRRKVRQTPLVGNVSRQMTRSSFDECTAVLRAMLYRPHFAFAKQGYAFATGGCWVLVYKLYDLPSEPEPNATLDLSTSSPTLSCADTYMIEIVSKPPPPQAPPQQYFAHVEAEMMMVSQWIRGLGETGVPDLSAFREKIPYKAK